MATKLFRDRLRDVRIMRQFTQAELAKRTEMPITSISHFEIGTRKPNMNSLIRLADALEVSTDYMLGRTDYFSSHKPNGLLSNEIDKLNGEDLELLKNFIKLLQQKKKYKLSLPM